MIIVKLLGGLGNQMFQYATAKALALRHQTSVKVDIRELIKPSEGKYTQRKFELDAFETHIEIASEQEISQFKTQPGNVFRRFIMRKFPSLFKNLTLNESGMRYHKEFNEYPANTYLNGFWQSELYFKAFRSEILKDFTFVDNIVQANANQLKSILNTNSVSVHIRRGDYVSNAGANTFHGTSSIEYYQTAIGYLAERAENIHLFVFSDDIPWCKKNIVSSFVTTYVETNHAQSDLYLMSNCKHNIIANSSFSWWGAWLNNNPDKIVIAPKQWLAVSSINTSDVIPTDWIKI